MNGTVDDDVLSAVVTVDDDVLSAVVTSRDAVTERTCSPTVPEIVRVFVPCGVDSVVLTVRMEVPFPETDGGLNAPPAFVGRPDTARVTGELNP